jgi:hypothetical protein
MTQEEVELRRRVDAAVGRMRTALNQCPPLDDPRIVDFGHAVGLVDEANDALREAMSCTDSLESLEDASSEAVLLVSSSRMALAVVREVLTLLTAELDSRTAA